MAGIETITRIWKDPPPALAFELSEAGVAAVRLGPKAEIDFHPLKAGVISVSPLRDNILMPDELAQAVREIGARNVSKKRRDAALIVPDYATRIAVLDFDDFPSDAKEQLSLIRFRLKKSVPYDIESAAVSYWRQPARGKKYDVVVTVAPIEIISRYEAPFRAAGMNPGLVVPSAVAALNLVEDGGLSVVAKLTGRVLTILVLEKGILRLVRCLELASPALEDVAADLYPTFIFIEDNLGAKAEHLLLCGFGSKLEDARGLFHAQLAIEVDSVQSPLGLPGEYNAGLLGYLRSIAQDN